MAELLVVVAAGEGRRLGGCAKALLEIAPGLSFLAAIWQTAQRAGVRAGVVVVGPPYGLAVADHARALGLASVENPHPALGMARSIALGFAHAQASAVAAAWLWPVDHAWVGAPTLAALRAQGGAAVVPTFGGRGGHPVLVRAPLFAAMAACDGLANGAREVLRRHANRCNVADAMVCRDFDHWPEPSA